MSHRVLLLGQPGLLDGPNYEPWPVERRFQMLSYLACAQDWVDRERLAALFWPDHEAQAARRNVRKVIHRALEVPWLNTLESRGPLVRWQVDTDLAELTGAVRQSNHARVTELYRGTLLEGFERGASAPYLAWLQSERLRWMQARRQAAMALIDAEPASRLRLAQSLLDDDPLDEDALLAAVDAQRALGTPAAADELIRRYSARLAADAGVEPSARVRALAAASKPQPVPQPVMAERFVGRRLEMAQTCETLRGSAPRALVLHGPGGIGKSRLAREALAALAPEFGAGAFWVDLEDLSDIAQVPARIVRSLALQWQEQGDAMAHIARQIGQRHQLLVFDNAEHLPPLGAQLAALIAACPQVRLLLTSRDLPTGLDAAVLEVSGLDIPDDQSLDLEAASTFDAVRLFAERATFQQPGFELTDHIESVTEIVAAVQGLPLAIEMAAAWVRLLPPLEIARELRSSLDLLQRDAAASAVRPRHASMRAVIERSWALLAPSERVAMMQLSVFVGGCTRESVREVVDLSLPLLASLVDKCLVQAHPEPGRFSLHPLIAAYAREQLAQDPARQAAAFDRHRAHFAAWLQRLNATARTSAGKFMQQVDAEYPNCRQAWEQAVAGRAAADVAAMAGALANYLENGGRYREGVALLGSALELDERRPENARALAQSCRALATLEYRANDHDQVELHARRGVRLARRCGDAPALLACLNLLGLSHWVRDQYTQALPYFEAALKQASGIGDRYGVAVFSGNIGLVAREAGQFDKSLTLLQAALAAHRELGNTRGVAISLNNIGNHHRLFGQWELARQCFNEGLARLDKDGIAGLRSALIVNLGLVELACGELAIAERHLRAALALAEHGAEDYLVNSARQGMARLSIRRAEHAQAHRWLADALRDASASGGTFRGSAALVVLAELRAAQGFGEQARELLAGVLGDARSAASVRVEAGRVLDSLGGGAGRALSAAELDQVVQRFMADTVDASGDAALTAPRIGSAGSPLNP